MEICNVEITFMLWQKRGSTNSENLSNVDVSSWICHILNPCSRVPRNGEFRRVKKAVRPCQTRIPLLYSCSVDTGMAGKGAESEQIRLLGFFISHKCRCQIVDILPWL